MRDSYLKIFILCFVLALPGYAFSAESIVLESPANVKTEKFAERLKEWEKASLESSRDKDYLKSFKQVPAKPVIDLKFKKLRGGPGMDGGGGQTVLSRDGELRFLDLALSEKIDRRRFDNHEYKQIMAKKGRFVSPLGTALQPQDFFQCAINLLSKQENILLKYLAENPLDIIVVMTNLPLDHSVEATVSTLGSDGWVRSLMTIPAPILASDSATLEEQRPVASYSMQEANSAAGLVHQTLLVNSQLYSGLSKRDQCGVQVHELLRYLANFGRYDDNRLLSLLNRPLATSEVEQMTNKIINQQKIHFDEIPATTLLKAFAMVGVESLLSMHDRQIVAITKMLSDSGYLANSDETSAERDDISLFETLLHYRISLNARKSVQLAGSGILEIARSTHDTNGAKWIRADREKLSVRPVDLFDFIKD